MTSDMLFWGGAPLPKSIVRDDNKAPAVAQDEFEDADRSEHSENDQSTNYDNSLLQSEHADDIAIKHRVPGGIAPISKPITANYDSDDARIIELKQQLYTNENVAKILEQEGRTRYQAKTVGSRWMRLRKIIVEKENEKLDDELSDWHVGEDEPLNNIIEEVETKFRKQLEHLEKKKWQEVSLHLAEKLGKRKYTGKACRERFNALKNGTALVPIELDKNPTERRKLREERIANAKQVRQDAAQATRDAEEAKRTRQVARKKEEAEAHEKRTASQIKRQQDKAERERIKLERRTNKEKAARLRQAILRRMRIQRDWELVKRRKENEICKRITGKNIDGRDARTASKKANHGYESEEAEESDIDDLESDEEQPQFIDDDDADDESERSAVENAAQTAKPRPSRRAQPIRQAVMKSKAALVQPTRVTSSPVRAMPADGSAVNTAKETTSTHVTIFVKAPVTKESLLNPRSIMNDAELDMVLYSRKLPRRNNESHAQVVARLDAMDHELKGPEIEALLAAHLVKTKGKKLDKIRRLQEADANKSDRGQMGVQSTDLDFMQRYEGYSGEFTGLLAAAESEQASAQGR